MYESPWFDGFLFGMSLVESNFPTDTGGKDPFVWIPKPSTFVKYVIKFVEEYVKNNQQIFFPAYLIPNLDYLSHRIKSYVVYIVIV